MSISVSPAAKPRLVALVGPTASGKTALSVALARALGGEIVCCDSMQVYRDMIIGTAAPTADEQAGVPHHLFGSVDPHTSFSCAEYVVAARETIREISARGGLAVVCGGTGLYLDALLLGGSFEDTPTDPAVRARLSALAREIGPTALHERLRAVDPASADAIHPNNVKRVLRALEIYECCGLPKSELDRRSREREPYYDATVLGLRYHSRDLLNARIDRRVEVMLETGLLEETARLDADGVFDGNATAAQAIGYKELLGVLRRGEELSAAADALKLATRHYAKRQMTWFSAKPYVRWVDCDTEAGQLRSPDAILCDALMICRKEGLLP